MIEGSLTDISLPGLLQLLADEAGGNYQIHIRKTGQSCDLNVSKGRLRVVKFGILEGLDALTEILSWTEGTFTVEMLPRDFVLTTKTNLNHRLDQPGSLTDQCAFLRQANVGLNTEIVPSTSFGTEEWQAALRIQPLGKYDYQVLGWITDGRTMHQAMVELNLDLRMTIGMLFRLVLTRSVSVVRPGNIDLKEYETKLEELVTIKLRQLAEFRFGPEKASDLEIESGASVSPAAKPEESAESEEKDTAESTTGSASSISQSKEASKGGTDTQELPIVPAALIDNVLSDESKQGKVRRKRVDTVESLPEQKPAPVSSVVSEQDREEAPSEIGSSAAFDIKRTDPLPMISIDIERLLQSVFNVTDKGRDLLLSKDVDALVKEVLKSVDRAKSLVLVLTDSNFSEASILATYSYCLNKGYIMHHDQVMELTVQLLLDRLDIEEYLLQRRRISSEQLNELRLISERQGIDLQKLLIGAGCLLPADLDRLKLERDRFVPQ